MKTQGIIKIEGKELGPIVGIMGICHGNEGVGKIALDFLRNFFKTNELKRGTLYLIEGNQKAFKENTICIDNNLNRIFVEEEKTRAMTSLVLDKEIGVLWREKVTPLSE